MPRRHALPGFGLSLGVTLTFLCLIVLIPLAMIAVQSAQLGPSAILAMATTRRALVAWVLCRYRFPGRSLLDALVDVPFAVPTAISGIALTTLYTSNGWIGQIA